MYSFSVRIPAPAAPGFKAAHFTLLARATQLFAALFGLILYAAPLEAGAAPPAAPAHGHTILVLGDSLSAGFGLDEQEGWVQLLRDRLAQQGYASWQVVNASISGETSDGGLRRLPPLLTQYKPAVVVVELGGNDGLRGLPVATTRTNLRQTAEESRRAGARVLLVGMKIPPNYGPVYANAFASIYPDLARSLKAPLVPFLLEGVAGDPDLMQPDGIHANAAGQPKLLDNVWPELKPLLVANRAHR